MEKIPRDISIALVVLIAAVGPLGCSWVEYYPEGSDNLTVASCEAEDGVALEGMITYDGEVPPYARLWVVFWPHLGDTGIPPCYVEVIPAAFPAQFRFNDVPGEEAWAMQVLLSMAGSFPPVPAEGDYWANISEGEIDYSTDNLALDFELEPYVP